MVGTGLDMGYMEFQFLEHELDQTVLISGTLKQGSSFFNQKIFYFKKLFLYLRCPEVGLRDLVQRKDSHGSSANRIGRSNYGGRASVNPQSGNGIKKSRK